MANRFVNPTLGEIYKAVRSFKTSHEQGLYRFVDLGLTIVAKISMGYNGLIRFRSPRCLEEICYNIRDIRKG